MVTRVLEWPDRNTRISSQTMLPHTKRRRAAERISVKYVDIITQHHEDITLSGKQLQQLLSEKLALGARRRGAKYVWVWG
jgi:hypothetical protein